MRHLKFLNLLALGALLAACRGYGAEPATAEPYAAEPYEQETGIAEEPMITAEVVDEEFQQWNKDANAYLSRDEFDSGVVSLFDEWDVDGDGDLSEEEVREGIWGTLDANDDDLITDNEWDAGWFEGTFADFTNWDDDGNEALTQDEFDGVWNEADLFAEWDDDNDDRLTQNEFGSTLFALWDDNDDDFITVNEWGL